MAKRKPLTGKAKEKANAQARAHYYANKAKLQARARKYHAEHKTPEREKASWLRGLKSRFGFTEADYMMLFEGQNGRCAICNSTGGVRRLAIDHDHVTGTIRGLLCGSCNTKLGFYEKFKQNIITYLRS